jgi:hypothetical protein
MQLYLGQLNCKTAVKIRLACYSRKKLQPMWSCSYVFRLSCKIVLSVDATVLVCTADFFLALYSLSSFILYMHTIILLLQLPLLLLDASSGKSDRFRLLEKIKLLITLLINWLTPVSRQCFWLSRLSISERSCILIAQQILSNQAFHYFGCVI